MFTAVATVFQQAMTEFSGAEPEEGHHKNCIKAHEGEWPLTFIGGKYDCAVEDQQKL
jgi:hypothetical protein